MKFARLPILIVAAAMLAGCGQKGPLVHPDTPKHKKVRAPAPTPATPTPPAPTPPAPSTPAPAADAPAPAATPASPSP